MKYQLIKDESGRPLKFELPKSKSFANMYLGHITHLNKYQETIDGIQEVLSGKREKKLLTAEPVDVLIDKDQVEFEFMFAEDVYAPDPPPKEEQFGYMDTKEFLELVQIWWKEYSQFAEK